MFRPKFGNKLSTAYIFNVGALPILFQTFDIGIPKVHEAVRIFRTDAEIILNSKSEFHQGGGD